MAAFNFYYPIDVRYGDIDAHGHVNNAKYLTFCEQARVKYVTHLGLWQGGSFLDFGIILAEIKITYHAPILFGTQVRVGVRVSRLGNKSMTMEQRIEDVRIQDAQTGQGFANCTAILVAYDYHRQSTILIPQEWREAIADFEGLPLSASP